VFIIGIDPHKGSHHATVIDRDEQVLGEVRVPPSPQQHWKTQDADRDRAQDQERHTDQQQLISPRPGPGGRPLCSEANPKGRQGIIETHPPDPTTLRNHRNACPRSSFRASCARAEGFVNCCCR
jgi:hypothetical protein